MLHSTEMKGSGWCGDMIKDRCTEGPLVETNGQKYVTLYLKLYVTNKHEHLEQGHMK